MTDVQEMVSLKPSAGCWMDIVVVKFEWLV